MFRKAQAWLEGKALVKRVCLSGVGTRAPVCLGGLGAPVSQYSVLGGVLVCPPIDGESMAFILTWGQDDILRETSG